MGPADPGGMIFKNMSSVVDTHRHNGTPGLLGNLKTAIMKFQESIRFPTAGPFREDADRDACFDLIDSRQDRLHAGLDIGAIQKYTMQIFHPGIQRRNPKNLDLRHITGKTRYTDIRNENVEIAPVIANIQYRFVFGDILFTDHGHSGTRKEQDNAKSPLNDGQRTPVFDARIKLADNIFC